MRTLRTCALTCKSWLARSQHNLFRSIRYDLSRKIRLRKNTYNAFRRYFVARPGPLVLDALANVLDSSPHLQPLVQEIEVLLPGDPRQLEQYDDLNRWGAAPRIDLAPLELCSRLLPALSTLRLVGFHRDANILESIFGAMFNLPRRVWSYTVTTLELHHVAFAWYIEFVGIYTGLVNLRNLECEHILWGKPFGFNDGGIAIEPCAVSRLRLEGLNEYEVRIPCPPPLLALMGMLWKDTSTRYLERDVGPLLAAVTSSLVDLTLDAAELLRPLSGKLALLYIRGIPLHCAM